MNIFSSRRFILAQKVFFLLIGIVVKMTHVMMQTTSVTLPSCSKHWPGIHVSFLAIDFDGTCTVHDTTSLYYKATDNYRNADKKEAKQLDQRWEAIGLEYLSGYQETITRLLNELPAQENRFPNEEQLKKFLLEIHKFDSQSTKKVEASKLLAGISQEGIADVATQVDLQQGCLEFMEKFNSMLHVITFNWSKDLVNNVLGKLKHLTITGNNFPSINNKSTGKIDKTVSSSLDKEKEFAQLLKTSQKGTNHGLSVFIGDSIGDLLALLKADVGIVIGQSGTMRKVCKAFGIIFVPLSDLADYYHVSVCNKTANMQANNILYETNSWTEIGQILLGNS